MMKKKPLTTSLFQFLFVALLFGAASVHFTGTAAEASDAGMSRAKVMILIEESYVDMKDLNMKMAETEISSRLAAKGYDLVDKAQLQEINVMAETRAALAGDINAAQSIGLDFGAQYVVVGKAVVQDVGEAFAGSGLRSIQASLQLKLVQTQTGLLLGSTVKNAVAAHISPLTGATKSLQEAAAKAVNEYLVQTIETSFKDFSSKGTPLTLQISGIDSFSTYRSVSKTVETINGVAEAKNDGWNKAGGLLTLQLRFKGTSEDLAVLLDGQDWGESKMEIMDLAPDRIDCSLQ